LNGDAGIGKAMLLAAGMRVGPDVLVLAGTCLAAVIHRSTWPALGVTDLGS